MATNRFSVISCMACIQPKRPFSNAPGSRRASTRRNVASEGMPVAKSRKRASHVLRSYPNSWIAAKELAPDSTPQTAMKTMLISGCLRVRSTRGSLRSWKWSWKAAGPSPGMIGSVGVRLRSLGDDTPLYAGAFPQATSDLYLDAAALGRYQEEGTVGNYRNPGQEWEPEGQPRRVKSKDFPDKELGKVGRTGS